MDDPVKSVKMHLKMQLKIAFKFKCILNAISNCIFKMHLRFYGMDGIRL